MVPERQAFHPSQKAVKAMADSTVSRPRRSRAKYRVNGAVEVKPSRPARKRRCISRLDSLSDSKTSDSSESCLEVPGSRSLEIPLTLAVENPKSCGSENPVTQGLPDPVTRGSNDPPSQGSRYPSTQGSVSKRSDDPATQKLPDPSSQCSVASNAEVSISESKSEAEKVRVERPPKRQKRKKSDARVTPESPSRSTSRARHDFGGGDRMLMRQWLEAEAEADRIPGLKWLDRRDRLIRINWRHGSRAEWSKNDVTVFKSWAQHTGRYNSSDPDYKRWKANFRCALNSLQDVEEVKEKRGTRAGDPYKVYRLLPAILPRKRRRESVRSTGSSSSPENIPATLETSATPTVTTPAEPMESNAFPVEEPLPQDLFLHLMPLPGGAGCEPVVGWSSGADLDGIPTGVVDMENLVPLDAPLIFPDHCYAHATNGIVQKIPSMSFIPPSPPAPPPPVATPFNNAIPLPVQNLIDQEEEEEKAELQTTTTALENLENVENLNELNINELFNFVDEQGNSIASTSLLETVLQALMSQPGIIHIQ